MLQERAGAGLHEHIEGIVTRDFPDRTLRIFDLGCGTGAFLHRLSSLGYRHLQGIDIAPPSDATGLIQFNAVDLDSGALPLPTASADLAILIEFIEHLENPGQLLAELARVLGPDGAVIITTPNTHSVEARLRWLLLEKLKQFDEAGDPTHIAPVFLFPFLKLCERHGWRARRWWGHPVDGSSPTSRPLLRMLSRVASIAGLRAGIPGDHLCIILERKQDAGTSALKADVVTSHYRAVGAEPAAAAESSV